MHELKILIDLSAGTRLPQYEQEIFSDKVLAEYYLRKLCGQFGWHGGYSVPCMIYYYASGVMNSRWPEAEAVIATDPEYACFYAKFVMKSRWPEAEHIIATDAYWGKWYNMEFGTSIK